MQTNAAGIAVIQAFESCLKLTDKEKLLYTTYLCPAGVLTIGWGTTRDDVPSLQSGETWTRTRCDDVFAASLKSKYEPHVEKLAAGRATPLTYNQFAALVSWAYNTGGPASSSVWAAVRAGEDARVPDLLARWNKADGRVLAGLMRRRKAEGQLYAGDVAGALKTADAHIANPLPMPQKKADEPPKPSLAEVATVALKKGGAVGGTTIVGGYGLASWWASLGLGEQITFAAAGIILATVVGAAIYRGMKHELENWA